MEPQPFRGYDEVKKERTDNYTVTVDTLHPKRGVKNSIAQWEINDYYYDFLVFCFEILIDSYALHLPFPPFFHPSLDLSRIRWLETSHDDDRR